MAKVFFFGMAFGTFKVEVQDEETKIRIRRMPEVSRDSHLLNFVFFGFFGSPLQGSLGRSWKSKGPVEVQKTLGPSSHNESPPNTPPDVVKAFRGFQKTASHVRYDWRMAWMSRV